MVAEHRAAVGGGAAELTWRRIASTLQGSGPRPRAAGGTADRLIAHADRMTYCLAINVKEGLVFCSDSRTNAGVDNVSVYSKMRTFCWPGDRFFVLLSAGNLATTQAVVKKLNGDIPNGLVPNLLSVRTIEEAADYVGIVSTQVQRTHANRDIASTNFEATFIFGGQIGDQPPEIFMVYPQGNYIHESADHPFLQIGEHKYGKPILDRVVKPETSLADAQKAVLLSMDSTLRSNLSVGMPLDLAVIGRDACRISERRRIEAGDANFRAMSEAWSRALREGFSQIRI